MSIVRRRDPLNVEASIATLNNDMVTPTADFFVRNHFPVPAVDPVTWRLKVQGLVHRPQMLTLRELHSMGSQTRIVTLECAGNGRARARSTYCWGTVGAGRGKYRRMDGCLPGQGSRLGGHPTIGAGSNLQRRRLGQDTRTRKDHPL